MYLDDLFAFANREDLPVLVQAAIVHAQFESIHPFTDGNGRIGRALINTVLRRRGATREIVIPVAAAIVADVRTYFDLLDRYRDGETAALISTFAQATAVAAREAQLTAQRIADLPARWREAVGSVRAGSTLDKLLDALSRTTALSADDVERFGSGSAAYRAIDRLVDTGILRPLTDRKRNQLWGVAALLDELDDLTRRIERAAPTVGRTRRAHNEPSSP
jgi:Fic family protein